MGLLPSKRVLLEIQSTLEEYSLSMKRQSPIMGENAASQLPRPAKDRLELKRPHQGWVRGSEGAFNDVVKGSQNKKLKASTKKIHLLIIKIYYVNKGSSLHRTGRDYGTLGFPWMHYLAFQISIPLDQLWHQILVSRLEVKSRIKITLAILYSISKIFSFL